MRIPSLDVIASAFPTAGPPTPLLSHYMRLPFDLFPLIPSPRRSFQPPCPRFFSPPPPFIPSLHSVRQVVRIEVHRACEKSQTSAVNRPRSAPRSRFYTFRITRETFFTLRSFRHARGRAISSLLRTIVLSFSRCRFAPYRRRCPRASSVYLFPSRNFPPILRLSAATYETPNRRLLACWQNFEDQVSS